MKSWYYHFKKKLSEIECESLKNYALSQPLVVGKVGYGGQQAENSAIRNSQIVWIEPKAETRWLFDRLVLCAQEANTRCFDLSLSNEPILSYGSAQFTQYEAASADHYSWHEDCDSLYERSVDRKLSLCVQLSHSSEYQGGSLEFERATLGEDVFTEMGDVIVFPSFLRHRVTTVTKGCRHSLVLWFFGPKLA